MNRTHGMKAGKTVIDLKVLTEKLKDLYPLEVAEFYKLEEEKIEQKS